MFGKNKIYSVKDFENEDKLAIQNIFYTIQGEGIFSGRPAVFIRCNFCSLSCFYCDTDFESNVQKLSTNDIYIKVKELAPSHCNLVVLTGGEPLLQPLIGSLIKQLTENNFIVQIETSGSVFSDNIDLDNPDLFIVCSPKTGKIHEKLVPYIDAYKYVISSSNYDEVDGLPSHISFGNFKQRVARPEQQKPIIYLSPMDEYDEEKNQTNLKLCAKLCMEFGYTLSLQIHKLVGVE